MKTHYIVAFGLGVVFALMTPHKAPQCLLRSEPYHKEREVLISPGDPYSGKQAETAMQDWVVTDCIKWDQ